MQMLEKVEQPRLNSFVYVKYGNRSMGITFTKVGVLAKGSRLFFHTGCVDECKCDEFRKPLFYKDYKSTWFKSLKEIKEKYKVIKRAEDYYEVRGEK